MELSVCRFLVLILVLALAFGVSVVGCGGRDRDEDADDDFDPDDLFDDDNQEDEDSDRDPCEDNHPPILFAVHYFVYEEELAPPVIVEQSDTTSFGIYFEYADADCNLPGGHFFVRFTAPQEEEDWQNLGVLPDELGCPSVESSLLYGFGFSQALDPAAYAGEVKWTDVCGAESNVITFEFTVVP